ncbi:MULTISPECIES: hypothetical protein [unclassified Streptomyces]|uniref:hypothetical protein n=1 Tax=unclassified Streptomyces TaxID=2593676 RepID=UPI0037013D6F
MSTPPRRPLGTGPNAIASTSLSPGPRLLPVERLQRDGQGEAEHQGTAEHQGAAARKGRRILGPGNAEVTGPGAS